MIIATTLRAAIARLYVGPDFSLKILAAIGSAQGAVAGDPNGLGTKRPAGQPTRRPLPRTVIGGAQGAAAGVLPRAAASAAEAAASAA